MFFRKIRQKLTTSLNNIAHSDTETFLFPCQLHWQNFWYSEKITVLGSRRKNSEKNRAQI